MPVQYITRPIIHVYTNQTAYNNGTILATLVEWAQYTIDYELWVLTFTSTYTMVVGQYIEILYYRGKINLRQFMMILNEWLRVMQKYFPNKELVEYTAAMAGLLPTDPQEVDKVDATALPFLDVNRCFDSLDTNRDIGIGRRGKYITFTSKTKTFRTDYGYTETEKVKQPVPFRIEWNLKPSQIVWNDDIPAMLNQVWRFPEVGYDALIKYCIIQMYMTRLSYNEQINAAMLKLDTMSIQSLLQRLTAELASLVQDSTIMKWFYTAGNYNQMNNNLSPTLQ